VLPNTLRYIYQHCLIEAEQELLPAVVQVSLLLICQQCYDTVHWSLKSLCLLFMGEMENQLHSALACV